MRKKTVNHLADTIFWYALYFLPVLAYLLYIFAGGYNTSVISFFDFMVETFLLELGENNIIATTLMNLFGTHENSIFPLFYNGGAIVCLTWFVSVYLLHLAVDFLLFIPRLCHKWLKKFTQGD